MRRRLRSSLLDEFDQFGDELFDMPVFHATERGHLPRISFASSCEFDEQIVAQNLAGGQISLSGSLLTPIPEGSNDG
jgi:hypothetical protein